MVVIGGGTAGLEAACTAAEVGCNTFLLEEKETLGGLAAEISKIPAKKRLADFPHYLEHRAAGLDNLYIFTGTQATPETSQVPSEPDRECYRLRSSASSDQRSDG